MNEKPAGRQGRAIPAVTLLLVLLLLMEALPLLMTDARPKPQRGVGTEVIGGTAVSQGNYRFMVYIEVPPGACSGTLISPIYVLTAAHCATEEFTGAKFAPEDFTLRIGRANLNDVSSANLFGVSGVTVHPDYDADPQAFHDDLAVLKLDRAVPKNIAQPIRLVKLSHQNRTNAGKEGIVAGWGLTSNPGSTSEQLMRASLTLSSSATCGAIFDTSFDPATMLCAEYAGHAGCAGDSGGPLVVKAQIGTKKKKGKKGHKAKKKPVYADVQAGVFTFGNACEDSAFMSLTAPEFNAFVVNAMES